MGFFPGGAKSYTTPVKLTWVGGKSTIIAHLVCPTNGYKRFQIFFFGKLFTPKIGFLKGVPYMVPLRRVSMKTIP